MTRENSHDCDFDFNTRAGRLKSMNNSQKPRMTYSNTALITTTLLLLAAARTQAEVTPAAAVNCQTTREFVTALEFLRADEDFKLKDKENEARDIAFKVAEGCTGAARRFIRVAKTLTQAGANRKDATEVALKFAQGKDAETDTFNTVFRRCIAEDSLDLDFDASQRIALQLSKEFAGDQKKVVKDFERVVDYCADTSRLGLPRTSCGRFAANVAQSGEKWEDGASKPFIRSFEYLASDSGPGLVTGDALKTAEMLAKQGPGAHENFQQAFQYATSSSGLNLPRDQAIHFAKKMAAITKVEAAEEKPGTKTDKKDASPAKKPGQ